MVGSPENALDGKSVMLFCAGAGSGKEKKVNFDILTELNL